MAISKVFHPKFILCMLAILAVIWITPEKIYSQAETTPPPSTTPSAPPSSRMVTPPRTTPKPTSKTTPAAPTTTPGEEALNAPFENIKRPSLITQAVVFTILAMLPFIVMMLTSFLKIVVVLSLLRTALGVQQAPPNQVINGIAFMLSLFVMYPTALRMYDISQESVAKLNVPESFVSPDSPQYILAIANETKEPLRDFLKKNSLQKHQILFYRLAYKVLPEIHKPDLKPTDFIILVPAFITSQLKDAFEIGVLIYIPFFVIDLVTSNILLAMGMMMLSPVTISMPLKLFLLVMLDGWTLLIDGLINTFVL